MPSKRNSRVYSAEEVGYPADSGSSTSSVSSKRSRRSSFSSCSREDFAHAPDMEEHQSDKKNDDVHSFKKDDVHAVPMEYPEAPLASRPVNFGVVVPGVYRSSYPQREDFAYMQALKLKTLVTLSVKEEGDRELTSFVTANGINHVLIAMKGTKKEAIPEATMKSILTHVLDRRNYPLMLHCNHGKHRTGCVVGVMRKLAGWDVGRTIDEYCSYAEPKIREVDVEYLSAIEVSSLGLLGQQQMRRALTPAQKHARLRAIYLAFGLWIFICIMLNHFWLRGPES